jgi:hypothetical protein
MKAYFQLERSGKENAMGYTMVPQNSRRRIKVNDKEPQEQLMYSTNRYSYPGSSY